MHPSSLIDLVYERQWSSLGNVVKALARLGRTGRLYGGFPKFRYTRAGIPAEIIRTFPLAALWNHAAGRLHLPPSFQLEEPRWVGNWVAGHKDLAPTVWANGTAHRFLFPKLKESGRTLILERGSSHPEPFFLLQQQARKEAGFNFNLELPPSVIDETAKNSLADFLIAGSDMIKDGYVERGFPAERAFSCAYGIDPSLFPFKERLLTASVKVGVVGIVGFRKGLQRAIRLGEWARDRNIPLEIHFIGPIHDNEAHAILNATKATIVVHGIVKGPELTRLLHSFNLYCLPSYEDGFGISVLEAMSSGLPSIVSVNTGAKEAIRHGKSGWILQDFSYEEFDNVLIDACKSSDTLQAMGLEAHKSILQHYTDEHYFRRVNSALQSITGMTRSSSQCISNGDPY